MSLQVPGALQIVVSSPWSSVVSATVPVLSAAVCVSSVPVVPSFRRSRRSPHESPIEIDEAIPAHSGVPFSHPAAASPDVRPTKRPLRIGTWRLYLALVTIVALLVLQKTKQAMLPARQTPVLWGAVLVVMACVLVLRSGWGRDNRWTEAQGELGTLANNFYEPRRAGLINGGAVAGGVLGGLWWAAATWAVVLGGMRRDSMSRGLLDFEVAAVAGAITGGVIGAVLGLVAGHIWERRYRRRRVQARRTDNWP